MEIRFSDATEFDSLQKDAEALEAIPEVKSIIILSADKNEYPTNEVDRLLHSLTKPVLGGIFPGIVFRDNSYEKGYIVAGLEPELQINVFENISTSKTLEDEIRNSAPTYQKAKTIFAFIDGFSKRIDRFVEQLFITLGLNYNFIGGGAGSLSFVPKPCLYTNAGLKQDAAVLAGIGQASGIGVKHGWEKIAGPFKVTQATATAIHELNFQSAFETYKEIVENHAQTKLTKENFFDIAKAYPFGISKFDAENIVRDPIMVEGESLICVGEVEQGSYVNILHGNNETLIQAAQQAVKVAQQNLPQESPEFVFLIDCISRSLFLGDLFKNELNTMYTQTTQTNFIGALTIGEIANNGQEYLEFYNKTAVIACF